VKPPSIMRVELMKRRGIMPTWPMAMLAMQGIMQRKLVNITLRNTARKNSSLLAPAQGAPRAAGGVSARARRRGQDWGSM
jgi:hypothetical protein